MENRFGTYERTELIKRGEVAWVDLPVSKKGSIQSSRRPCLIVSNDACNRFSPVITVLPITSQIKKKDMPTHVVIDKINDKFENAMILAEQIITVNKTDVLSRICNLKEEHMKQVNKALMIQTGVL